MGSRRASSLILFASLLVLAPRESRADAPGVVRLAGSCVPPGTSLDATLRILSAELSPLAVEALAGTPPGADDVLVAIDDCREEPPSAHFTIWFRGSSREQAVNLADAEPDARNRAFALAIAEATRGAPSFAGRKPTNAEGSTAIAVAAAPVAGTPVVAAHSTLPSADLSPNDPEAHPAERQARSPRDTMAPGRDDRGVRGVKPRVSGLFRVVPSPSTVLFGGDLALAWRRGGIGLTSFGTERSISIGSTTLLAFAAAPWVDVIEIAAGVSLRAGAELGIALATATAAGAARATPANASHLALDAGVAGVLDVGSGWTLDGFVGAGYASSLTVTTDGRNLASLGGAFVTTSLGVRVPGLL